MAFLARVRHLFRAVFRRAELERDLSAELQFHLDREAAGHRRAGLDPAEAGAAALRDFGGPAQVQEACRDAWGGRLLDQLRQDLGYAWRGLGRNPGFTAAALATLTLGIGASTAMFSVVNSVLLRPLPYRDPGRLVILSSDLPLHGITDSSSGYANIDDWRKASRTLRHLAAFDGSNAIVTDARGEARNVSAAFVSASVFDALGVAPALGRPFTAEECARGEGVAVLSDEAWRRYFGPDPGAIGRTLLVAGRPVEVIGVMPPGFYFPKKGVVFLLPETLARGWANSRLERGTGPWRAVARLAEGVSLDEARTELAGIGAVLEKAHPAANAGLTVRVESLAGRVAGRQVRLALLVLVGAVTAVLLIACSNVANLLLARGAARQREFAIREALGAGRGRLVRQLLAECALLALLAATTGAALAYAALRALQAFGPELGIPRFDEIALDPAALAFAVLLAGFSGLASGLLPALRSTQRDPMSMLRGAGRGLSEGAAARRGRSVLVATQFALAIILLIATGLLSRSFVRLTAVDVGFRADQVLVIGMRVPSERPEEQAAVYAARLLERVRALPGVISAGTSEEVLQGEASAHFVTVEGGAAVDPVVGRVAMRLESVSPGYFTTVGVALRSGRFFTDQDTAAAPGVVLVNETFARRFWPQESPVGRRLRLGEPGSTEPWLTVVGVVADVRRQGPDRAPVALAFRPLAQHPARPMNLVVATAVDPAAFAPTLRAAVVEVDRAVPVGNVERLRDLLDRPLALREFNLGLIGAFAAIALTLAGIGIFGLINYSVTRRTQEIGIRLALGAQPGDILRMVLGDGLRLALAGILLGAAGSALLMPVMASLLFEVSFADPLAFGGAGAVLLAVALLASYLPARRAVTINPVTALQTE
ncbi:MAG: ABC transporter permease [Opitutaceae bacterium]|nr:ABC transporter permease [Opitutaceae bacterium]